MFRTDENIYMSGFHMSWFLAAPSEVVVIDTTTAVTDGNAGAQGVETTPGKQYHILIYTQCFTEYHSVTSCYTVLYCVTVTHECYKM